MDMGRAMRVRISFGVNGDASRRLEDAVRHADDCLYAAKSGGGNRVHTEAESPAALS